MMSDARGATVLSIARAAIAQALGQPGTALEDAPWLQASGASFVTLTQGKQLRGCIGSLQAHRRLLDDVKANAVAAALRDPRFAPMAAQELQTVRIGVALLSALHPMVVRDEAHALAQLRPGIDGLMVECQGRRSTFLPQVWEQLPDPRDFLGQLKAKAGLPADFWSQAVRLHRYTVSKWEEGVDESTSAAHDPRAIQP